MFTAIDFSDEVAEAARRGFSLDKQRQVKALMIDICHPRDGMIRWCNDTSLPVAEDFDGLTLSTPQVWNEWVKQASGERIIHDTPNSTTPPHLQAMGVNKHCRRPMIVSDGNRGAMMYCDSKSMFDIVFANVAMKDR